MIIRLQMLKGFAQNIVQVELYVPDAIADKVFAQIAQIVKQTPTKNNETKSDD